jgi:hypothetical protein
MSKFVLFTYGGLLMKKHSRSILIVLVVFALVTISCGISLPTGTIDTAATSIAATIEALAGTAIVALTPEAHDLPTVEPTAAPVVYPVKVSFVSPDRDLYVWDESMPTAQKRVDTGDVSGSVISPDGTLVVYTRTADFSNYSLEVINFDGSGQRVLMDAAAFAALPRPSGSLSSSPSQMAFVPNSHTLVFNTRVQYEGPGLAFNPVLHRIDVDADTISNILNIGEAWKFTYSPDGSKIAISQPTGVGTYNADGTLIDDNILTYPFVNTASEYAWVASPQWSADSTQMMVAVPPQDPWTDPVGDGSLWRVAADGMSGEQTLSTPMIYYPGGFAYFSPDLSKVIFFTRFGAPVDSTYTLHTANVDGTNNVSYVNGLFDQPVSWSPDNTRFFYTDRVGDVRNSYIGTLGAPPALIPDINNAGDSKWIDANRFLVSTLGGGTGSLLLGTVGAPTGVIYSGTGDNFLSFSVNR